MVIGSKCMLKRLLRSRNYKIKNHLKKFFKKYENVTMFKIIFLKKSFIK